MHRHSTATLMGLTKRELVEYVRMAEHNQEVAEETLNQQAENVKDWIPVVRCKDCKHYKPQKRSAHWSNSTPYCCRCTVVKVNPDDFCSYGERRSE
jgi:hypothetical protein